MSAGNGARLAFSDPPVFTVSLTVFFEPIEGLQTTHLSSLREAWKADYPHLAELPPLRPRNRGGDEAALVPISSSWPCPYVMFSSENDGSSIAIQNDRFIRSWFFPSEPSKAAYPGFEAIRSDLLAHFVEFKEAMVAELGQEVVVVGSECDYVNLIGGELSLEQLMVGVTTKWTVDVLAPIASVVTSGGVRLHLCGSDDLEGCSVTLRLEVDSDGPTMEIESAFDLAAGEVDEAGLGGLDLAHAKLIETFLEYTSEDMHKMWGRQ